MAPDVLRGLTVTSLSDLYSRGALAYRLLAGPAEPRRTATADGLGSPPRTWRLADVRPGRRSAWRSPSTALERVRDARQSSVAEFRDQLRAADRPGAQLVRREAA